jgi:cobyrinic acid a,c-diamide synthase
VGKTTVAIGLMAALARRGLAVAPAKVGPDFIDPGYHALATGRPGRNLDSFLCGAEAIAPLAARAAGGADVLLIEGVMGLFDGSGERASGESPAPRAPSPGLPPASTAEVAALLDAPVVLVVDASAMSGSVAAVVHGFATLSPTLRVAGVVLNRVGSDGHEALLRDALAPLGLPVLGALRVDPACSLEDRHLGLVPVVEHPDEVRRSLDRLAEVTARQCDLGQVMDVAKRAPFRAMAPPSPLAPVGRARVAVAAGSAFSFAYPDNLEALEEAGADLVPFDPAVDPTLPEGVDGLYVGGGFPEAFLGALAANRPLLAHVRRRVEGGLPTWAECGGLLWLCRSLDGARLCGAVPAEGTMTGRLTLGYRRASIRVGNPVGVSGAELRGHEFHYSQVEPSGDALLLRSRFGEGLGGFASPTMLASYLHVHMGIEREPARRFVRLAAGGQRRQSSP